MLKTMGNCTVEIELESTQSYVSPFEDIQLYADITSPDGVNVSIPAFWAGENRWIIRYSSNKVGVHRYTTRCSDEDNYGLNGIQGSIEVSEYTGNNSLYIHGAIQKSQAATYMEHKDGTPFFWFADTWWMGLTKRLSWPVDYRTLLNDRVDKGFNVVQIVAGLYPDMEPFDDRGANEAGFPWDREFQSINPAYFNEADEKIMALVDAGIVPCIVGCWGFFMHFAGKDVLKRHWDYLIARYVALPVVWCIAGEATMPFYTQEAAKNPERMKEYQKEVRADWTEVTKYVKENDPYQRLITIHPTQFGRDMVDDDSLLDLEMLQTGHSGLFSAAGTVDMVQTAVQKEPHMPVINSEVSYEGICGSSLHDAQRFLFWVCVLNGTCGHTYGANGIWQVNAKDRPYGVSPHGASWGHTTWEEAYQLQGSSQLGIAVKLLSKYRWWKFESHPEWVDNHATKEQVMAIHAAGIPREIRILFLPFHGGCSWRQTVVKNLEPDVQYKAFYFDPISGDEFEQGLVRADEQGQWSPSKANALQDWILVLEAV